MVKLNKIYTRTGDDGTTGLVRGPRRQKHDLRIDAYGTVEETNAFIGLARLHTNAAPEIDHDLNIIQNDLFDVGSDLATPGEDAADQVSLRATAQQVAWLETRIDHYNDQLSALTSFILPGGSPLAAALHAARTIARRAERLTTALRADEPDTNPTAVQYLNRLSDLLFVLGRAANNNGENDVLWTPGQHTGMSKPSGEGSK